MLYLFTWNSDYLVKEQVKAWKNKFITNYWEFNLIHIKNFDTVENNFLTLNITSASFLSEKKLVIIDLDTKEKDKVSKKTDEPSKKDNETLEREELLVNLLWKIPDNNIILINTVNPDKRTKFYKYIVKIVKDWKKNVIKELNTTDDSSLQWIISTKYWKQISNQAISSLIRYKSWNLSKIISEIEKLLINFDYIDNKEVIENIAPELEESVFQVIDDLLNKNIPEAINKIEIILNDTVIYAFYNNLLANLRTSMYIFKLKDMWKSKNDISNILDLKNREFLVDKRYRINYKELNTLYINILNIDKKMKLWKLVWTEDIDFKFELDKEILKMKKQ